MEVSGLEVNVSVEDLEEGGENSYVHKLPGRMTWPNITLKRGITQNDTLLTWLNKSSGEQFAANGNKLTRSTAAITLVGPCGPTTAGLGVRRRLPDPLEGSAVRRRVERHGRRGAGDRPPRLPRQGSRPDVSDDAAGTTPRPDFGRAIVERVAPRRRVTRTVVGRAAGEVSRRSVQFAGGLGLSSTSRWARDTASGADVDGLSVRPPIDYWPWSDDAGESDDVARTAAVATSEPVVRRATPTPRADPFGGDRRLAMAARLAGLGAPGSGTAAPASVPAQPVAAPVATTASRGGAQRRARGSGTARPVRRGLPIAAARLGRTAAGPATSPGAIASSLKATLDPTPPAPEAAVRRSSRPSATAPGRAGATSAPSAQREPPVVALPPDLDRLRRQLIDSGQIRPPTDGGSAARPSPSPTTSPTTSAGPAGPAGGVRSRGATEPPSPAVRDACRVRRAPRPHPSAIPARHRLDRGGRNRPTPGSGRPSRRVRWSAAPPRRGSPMHHRPTEPTTSS